MNDPIFPGQTSLTIADVDGGYGQYLLGDAEAFKKKASDNINNADKTADHVADIVEDMEANAGNLAWLAEQAIQEALQFSASLDPVTYNVPAFTQTNRSKVTLGSAPTIGNVPSSPGVTGYIATVAQDGFVQAPGAGAPSLITITTPAFPATSASISAPAALSDVTIADTPVPVVSYTLKDAAALQAIHDGPVIDVTLNFQPFDTAKFDPVPTSELERVIANIGAAGFAEPAGYNPLLPSLMTYVGTLLSDSFVGDKTQYAPFAQHVRGTDVWQKRGMAMPEFDAYTNDLQARMADRADDTHSVFLAEARAEATLLGYDIGLAAYGMLLELESARVNAEFNKNMAEATAHLEKIRASTAVYNAMVSIYQAAATEYNAELTKLGAEVDKFKAEAGIESLKARMNTVKSEAFSATERAKGVRVSEFIAKVGEQEARLSLYAAQLGQFDAVLAKQEAAVAKYSGQVAEWEAKLVEADAAYKAYSGKVKGYIAQLQAGEASQQLQQVEHNVVATLAKQQAAQVDVLANKLSAEAKTRATSYDITDAGNALKGIGYQIKEANYSAETLNWARSNVENAMEWNGIGADARAKTQFAQQIMQSVGRAAQLTQSGNIQIANAYASINEAAGRAGAAIRQGQMSGFRASVALSAAGSISGSMGWGYSDSQGTKADAQYIEQVDEKV